MFQNQYLVRKFVQPGFPGRGLRREKLVLLVFGELVMLCRG